MYTFIISIRFIIFFKIYFICAGLSRYRVIDWDGAMDELEAAGSNPKYSRNSPRSCFAEGPVSYRGAPEIALALRGGNQQCKLTPAIDMWEAGDVIAAVGLGCR